MIYPQNFEQKIGFDEIRRLLKGHCLSTLGQEKVEQMQFMTELQAIRQRQEQTREFIKIMEGEEEFPAQDFFDVRPAIRRIRVEGTYLDENELFDLKRSLATLIAIVQFLNKGNDESEEGETEGYHGPYPALHRLAPLSILCPCLIQSACMRIKPY